MQKIPRNWKPGDCACLTIGIISITLNPACEPSFGCALSRSWQRLQGFSITGFEFHVAASVFCEAVSLLNRGLLTALARGASVGRKTHLPWRAVPGRAPSQRLIPLVLLMHPHEFLAFVHHADETIASYKPLFAEVFPLRIHGIDQCNFLCSQPTLDLFLAFKRNMYTWS